MIDYTTWTRQELAIHLARIQENRGIIDNPAQVAMRLLIGCGAVKPQTKAQLITAIQAVTA
jgi:hypothetical protein